MANLTLELNINSARNLTNVNLFTKMDVYAVTTVNGDYNQKKHKSKTAVDYNGGSNPTWNHAVKVSVNERLALDGRLTLVVKLVARRVLGNKEIGSVNVPLVELLNSITPSINGEDGNGKEMRFVTYQVKSPSGKRKGTLVFSYRFEPVPIKPEFAINDNRSSVPACPPPSESDNSSVPPPSKFEHSRSAPPKSAITVTLTENSDHLNRRVAVRSRSVHLPISYGPTLMSQTDRSVYAYHHAPPPLYSPASHREYGSNGYAPPSPAKGTGLGLGVGLLGGLMMGDIVSDVANCYDL
ncbi:unnamed protein product [Cochlearia groenlandica]